MKPLNKKTPNYNLTTKTINHTIPNTTSTLKILGIFHAQTRSSDHPTNQFELYQFEENHKHEIEAELKRNQARTYSSLTPLR